jgi:hypothetical protein
MTLPLFSISLSADSIDIRMVLSVSAILVGSAIIHHFFDFLQGEEANIFSIVCWICSGPSGG